MFNLITVVVSLSQSHTCLGVTMQDDALAFEGSEVEASSCGEKSRWVNVDVWGEVFTDEQVTVKFCFVTRGPCWLGLSASRPSSCSSWRMCWTRPRSSSSFFLWISALTRSSSSSSSFSSSTSQVLIAAGGSRREKHVFIFFDKVSCTCIINNHRRTMSLVFVTK